MSASAAAREDTRPPKVLPSAVDAAAWGHAALPMQSCGTHDPGFGPTAGAVCLPPISKIDSSRFCGTDEL